MNIYGKGEFKNMREIKFRAWDTEHKKIRPVGEITWDEKGDPCNVELLSPEGLEMQDFTKRFILMQYTGLNDKNGKEIYEGDIVRVDKKIGHIKYRPAAFVIYYKEPIWEAEGSEDEVYSEWCHIPRSGVLVEVIGNIYENPDLLEKTI